MAEQFAPVPYDGPHSADDLELFGPFRFLYPVLVEGQPFLVPEGNSVLRALQFVQIRHQAVRLPWWDYCWNNTVGCCDMLVREVGEAEPRMARACTTAVKPGMEIVRLPKGGKLCKPR